MTDTDEEDRPDSVHVAAGTESWESAAIAAAVDVAVTMGRILVATRGTSGRQEPW